MLLRENKFLKKVLLLFRENKFLRKVTFLRMNEVENLYHATPQHYYKCIRQRFGNEKIGKLIHRLFFFLVIVIDF